MILVDTSAWVELLRATGSPVHRRLRELLTQDETPLATTEAIVMEVLAGARDDAHVHRLRSVVLSHALLPVDGLVDFEDAATLYRRCRAGGGTVRSLVDCLIATVAIKAGAELLHADRDYETIARHTPLRIASLPSS
jgi:predicted nucleic acid-binding protein